MRAITWAALAAAACNTAPAAYPDASKVHSAEAGWCAALAKYEAPEGQSWRHGAECSAFTPTGAPAFVAKMTECYAKTHADHPDAPDLGALIGGCADDVINHSTPGEVTESELMTARCARMARCEQVAKADCLNGFDHLDPGQKFVLTSEYNLRGQHEIAECLASSDCTADEDGAQRKCYQEAERRRVWLPGL